jgi:hypothetical protein
VPSAARGRGDAPRVRGSRQGERQAERWRGVSLGREVRSVGTCRPRSRAIRAPGRWANSPKLKESAAPSIDGAPRVSDGGGGATTVRAMLRRTNPGAVSMGRSVADSACCACRRRVRASRSWTLWRAARRWSESTRCTTHGALSCARSGGGSSDSAARPSKMAVSPPSHGARSQLKAAQGCGSHHVSSAEGRAGNGSELGRAARTDHARRLERVCGMRHTHAHEPPLAAISERRLREVGRAAQAHSNSPCAARPRVPGSFPSA